MGLEPSRMSLLAAVLILSASVTAATELSEPERRHLVAHMEMTGAWLEDEVSGLSQAQLEFRRAPGSWSIGEVLEHLILVGPIYWNDLQEAIKAPAGARTLTSRDEDILWYGIDRTRPEKAIPSEMPKAAVRALPAALDAYRQQHARLLNYVRTTKDDLRSHVVTRQSCDAYQWALLISTHEQRHVLQIREIKADPRFLKRFSPGDFVPRTP